MRYILPLILSALVACVDEEPDPIPLCPDVGCDYAYCTADGECTCPQEDGEPIACRFETDLAE